MPVPSDGATKAQVLHQPGKLSMRYHGLHPGVPSGPTSAQGTASACSAEARACRPAPVPIGITTTTTSGAAMAQGVRRNLGRQPLPRSRLSCWRSQHFDTTSACRGGGVVLAVIGVATEPSFGPNCALTCSVGKDSSRTGDGAIYCRAGSVLSSAGCLFGVHACHKVVIQAGIARMMVRAALNVAMKHGTLMPKISMVTLLWGRAGKRLQFIHKWRSRCRSVF
jgi:hypothetical protein